MVAMQSGLNSLFWEYTEPTSFCYEPCLDALFYVLKIKKAINNIFLMRCYIKYHQWSLKFVLIKKLLINNFSLNLSRPTRTKFTVVSKYLFIQLINNLDVSI